jgi:hypothetical protein
VQIHRPALPFHFLQSGLHVLVLEIEGFDAGFGGFGFVEMLIDGGRLLLAEPNEVDDVREDLDEAVVGRFEEVRE